MFAMIVAFVAMSLWAVGCFLAVRAERRVR